MTPIILTSINEWGGSSGFVLFRPDDVIGIQATPGSVECQAVLFLSSGVQVKVKETASEVMSALAAQPPSAI